MDASLCVPRDVFVGLLSMLEYARSSLTSGARGPSVPAPCAWVYKRGNTIGTSGPLVLLPSAWACTLGPGAAMLTKSHRRLPASTAAPRTPTAAMPCLVSAEEQPKPMSDLACLWRKPLLYVYLRPQPAFIPTSASTWSAVKANGRARAHFSALISFPPAPG